jgi:plastocyanin domain-containing protein
MAKGEIGDPLDEVARTGKLGKRSQPSKSSAVQSAETSTILKAESRDSQIPKPSEVQMPARSTAQQSNSSDVPSVEGPALQPSEPLNTQTFEMVKGQHMNSVAVQESKGTHKGRTQKTIYLPPALAKQLNFAAVEEEREISEIVTDALKAYFNKKGEGRN